MAITTKRWFVVLHNAAINAQMDEGFDCVNDAVEKAYALHTSSGNHYDVMAVQSVWTSRALNNSTETEA